MYQTQMEDAWTVAIGKHCSPCLFIFDWLLPTTSSANNESQVQLTTWHSMSVCPVAVHLQHLWAIAPSHSVAHQLKKTKWNGYCANVQNYSTPPINSHSDSNSLPRSVCAKRTENKFTLLPVQIIAQRVYLGNLKTRLLQCCYPIQSSSFHQSHPRQSITQVEMFALYPNPVPVLSSRWLPWWMRPSADRSISGKSMFLGVIDLISAQPQQLRANSSSSPIWNNVVLDGRSALYLIEPSIYIHCRCLFKMSFSAWLKSYECHPHQRQQHHHRRVITFKLPGICVSFTRSPGSTTPETNYVPEETWFYNNPRSSCQLLAIIRINQTGWWWHGW